MSPPSLQHIPTVFKQAQAAQAKGELQAAEDIYQSILATKSDIPEVHFQLGQIALARSDLGQAANHLTAALILKPTEPVLWKAIIGPLRQLRDPVIARRLLPLFAASKLPTALKFQIEQALALAQKTSKAAASVIAFRIAGQASDGIRKGIKLLKTHPKDFDLLIEVALLQTREKAHADAFKTFQRACKLRADAPFPHMQSAILLQRLGKFDKASDILRALIARHPTLGEPYWLLIVGVKVKPDDPLIAQMQMAKRKATDPVSQMFLGYALGKAMQDIGEHTAVFDHLNRANSIGRKMYPYDVTARQKEVVALKASFQDAKFSPVASEGMDIAPIFVTGMPRSGTTLVEQIIASHPMVTAGGETGLPLAAVYDQLWRENQFQPYGDFTAEQKRQIGETYATRLRSAVEFETHVTDKSIQSHLVIGPLLECIPNAKIIVVHRDPRDVALSCFKNFFPEGTHRYSTDLRDLARYILTFKDIVGFWRDTLSKGSFHEITYDTLIKSPEVESKALIAACGLDWDARCLKFHESKSAVSTLSVAQVRQPIYASSARGWEKYSDELQPLIDILEAENGII